jgi:hypothetical protein
MTISHDPLPDGVAPPSAGRTLVSSLDGRVVALGDDRFEFVCEGGAFALALRVVGSIGGAVTVVVSGLLAARLIPRLLVLVLLTWVAGALAALAFTMVRKRQHGRFVFDFAARTWARAGHEPCPLEGEVLLEPPMRAHDDDSEHWLLFRPKGGRILRLGRAPLRALHPVLYVFRRHGVPAPLPPRA